MQLVGRVKTIQIPNDNRIYKSNSGPLKINISCTHIKLFFFLRGKFPSIIDSTEQKHPPNYKIMQISLCMLFL